MALLVLFFALVLLVSSRRINATVVDSLEQRFSNQRLLGNLNAAQLQMAEINQQLLLKIDAVEAAERHTSRSNAILDAINQAQMHYLQNPNLQELFDELLSHLLELTDSEYGFIGQVLR